MCYAFDSPGPLEFMRRPKNIYLGQTLCCCVNNYKNTEDDCSVNNLMVSLLDKNNTYYKDKDELVLTQNIFDGEKLVFEDSPEFNEIENNIFLLVGLKYISSLVAHIFKAKYPNMCNTKKKIWPQILNSWTGYSICLEKI